MRDCLVTLKNEELPEKKMHKQSLQRGTEVEEQRAIPKRTGEMCQSREAWEGMEQWLAIDGSIYMEHTEYVAGKITDELNKYTEDIP